MARKSGEKKDEARKGGTLRVSLVRSTIGRLRSHKACVQGLGLRRIGQTVEVMDTPENRGMIRKVLYLLAVEEPCV